MALHGLAMVLFHPTPGWCGQYLYMEHRAVLMAKWGGIYTWRCLDGTSFIWLMNTLGNQGESVNILLNFTQFFETRIEYRFQIFTAHSCDFLLPSYARLA